MSYTALYRKFRPDCFDDVKGQEHIVTTLKNQIKSGRIGHAYLFCGTRGTGKTTIAKILAKSVNCENPIDGNPCNACPSCIAIRSQASMNVIEIDAASNNGVDNVREIIEEVRYSPTEARYKVYIIDEVHMLSTGAFNALLKTLEEPPSYVIFIMATTEVHKIPITILSRCQRYDFKRITVDQISGRLTELIKIEQVDAEERAIRYIAKAADGSMRDALSLLDQCIAFFLGEVLTYDRVLEVLGTVDIETFSELFRSIQAGSVEACISILDKLVTKGRELTQFITDFTWYIRNLLLAGTAENPENFLEISSEQMELLLHEAARSDPETLIRYIRILSELSGQIKYASQKRVLVEVTLIKLCKPSMETDYQSLVSRIKVLEKLFEHGLPPETEVKKISNEPQKVEPAAEIPAAISSDLTEIARQWHSIVAHTCAISRNILINAVPSPGNGNRLIVAFSNAMDKEAISKQSRLEELNAVITKKIGKTIEIELRLIEGGTDQLKKIPDLTKLIKHVPIEYVEE